MSELCITPTSQSAAQGNKFAISFNRIQNTVFQITKTALPGINSPAQEQKTPFVNLPVPGNKVEFEPLTFEFIVDNQYNSWYSIYTWLVGVSFPENFQQYANLKNQIGFNSSGIRPPYSDASLIIMTNQNVPQARIHFYDCFPTFLSSIPLGYDVDANTILKAKATFRYSYYTFISL